MKNSEKWFFVCFLILLQSCAAPNKEIASSIWSGVDLRNFVQSQNYLIDERMPLGFMNWVSFVAIKSVAKDHREVESLRNKFLSWCAANEGAITSTYKKFPNTSSGYTDYGDYFAAMTSLAHEQFGSELGNAVFMSGRECLSVEGKQPIAAIFSYENLKEKNSFTGPGVINVAVLDAKGMQGAIEKKSRFEQQKRDVDAAYAQRQHERSERIVQCRAEAALQLRTFLKPGVLTDRGMVVDVKAPIASIQTSSGLLWLRIDELSVPLGTCYGIK